MAKFTIPAVTIEAPAVDDVAALAALLGRPETTSGALDAKTGLPAIVPNPVAPDAYVVEHVAQLLAARVKERRRASIAAQAAALASLAAADSSAPAIVVASKEPA